MKVFCSWASENRAYDLSMILEDAFRVDFICIFCFTTSRYNSLTLNDFIRFFHNPIFKPSRPPVSFQFPIYLGKEDRYINCCIVRSDTLYGVKIQNKHYLCLPPSCHDKVLRSEVHINCRINNICIPSFTQEKLWVYLFSWHPRDPMKFLKL